MRPQSFRTPSLYETRRKGVKISNKITDCIIPTYRKIVTSEMLILSKHSPEIQKLSSSTLWIMDCVLSLNRNLEWGDRAGNINPPRACAADTEKLKHFCNGGGLWNHCIMSPDGTKEISPFPYN